MKKYILILLIAIIVCGLCIQYGYTGEKKLAQTGFQFLSVPTQARAAAMGEAFTAVAAQSSSLFYNPANMARVNSLIDLSISQNKWIADIDHNAGSIAFNPSDGYYGVFGLSILSVDYGEFLGTRVDPTSEKGYEDTGLFSPSAYAIGIGYAKSLTDRFSFGIHVKYASQTLGNSVLPDEEAAEGTITVNNSVNVLAFDFGTIYQTGLKSLTFGMTVRNFSKEVTYETEGFQLPLTFKMGMSLNIMDLFTEQNEKHSFLLAIEATHPRAFSERVNFGGEYLFMDILALRIGYNYNKDEQDISGGFGVQKQFGKSRSIALDYAYTPFGVFDKVQRLSFRLSF